MNTLELFWTAVWNHHDLLVGIRNHLYLVYHTIDEITEEDARAFLTVLVHDYVMLGYGFAMLIADGMTDPFPPIVIALRVIPSTRAVTRI